MWTLEWAPDANDPGYEVAWINTDAGCGPYVGDAVPEHGDGAVVDRRIGGEYDPAWQSYRVDVRIRRPRVDSPAIKG